MLISGKMFDRHAEIRAECRFGRFKPREKISLERTSEEALRQIFRVFIVLVEFDADKSVDGLPIKCDHATHRFFGQAVVGGFEQRNLRRRKTAERSADGSIWVHV